MFELLGDGPKLGVRVQQPQQHGISAEPGQIPAGAYILRIVRSSIAVSMMRSPRRAWSLAFDDAAQVAFEITAAGAIVRRRKPNNRSGLERSKKKNCIAFHDSSGRNRAPDATGRGTPLALYAMPL
jgi:hypothetical protein